MSNGNAASADVHKIYVRNIIERQVYRKIVSTFTKALFPCLQLLDFEIVMVKEIGLYQSKKKPYLFY